MKVLAVQGQSGGVGQYRLHQPAAVLRETEPGLDVEIVEELPLVVNPYTHRIVGIGDVDCDVLVLQLPMIDWLPEAISDLQRRGIKVVVEIDDDLQGLHPAHMSYFLVDPGLSPHRNWRHLLACCQRADLVTCSTPALKERYGYGHGVVLRNYVKRELLEIPHNDQGRVLGWAGSTGVHPNDLQSTRGGVGLAVDDCDAHFLLLGPKRLTEQVVRWLALSREPELVPWVPFEMYSHVLSKFDVGIVPLADSRFNSAKSWLKGVEYAAVGVPFVASDVAEYRDLRESFGLGTLVPPRARNWRGRIKELLTNDELRKEQSERGRQIVRDHLTIEDNAWRWAEAWESVVSRSRAAA